MKETKIEKVKSDGIKQMKRLQSIELNALRRSCRVSKLQKFRNDIIKQRIGFGNIIMEETENNLFGESHIMRMVTKEKKWKSHVKQ